METRRSFYTALISGLGTIIGAGVTALAGIYLLWNGPTKRRAGFVEAIDLAQLETGKPKEVVFERTRVDGWRTLRETTIAWVVRADDSKVVAYAPQCTHLGCAYHWEDHGSQFVCPCHGSRFAIDGKVIEGPASRPLDRWAVCVESDKVLISPQVRKA